MSIHTLDRQLTRGCPNPAATSRPSASTAGVDGAALSAVWRVLLAMAFLTTGALLWCVGVFIVFRYRRQRGRRAARWIRFGAALTAASVLFLVLAYVTDPVLRWTAPGRPRGGAAARMSRAAP